MGELIQGILFLKRDDRAGFLIGHGQDRIADLAIDGFAVEKDLGSDFALTPRGLGNLAQHVVGHQGTGFVLVGDEEENQSGSQGNRKSDGS